MLGQENGKQNTLLIASGNVRDRLEIKVGT